MKFFKKIKFNLLPVMIAALLFCPSFLSAAETVIESADAKLIMNFNEGLNIADGDSLRVVYTGSAADPSALLRDASGNPSYWGGSFWSNYSVIFVNPNGITIGANANIQAASFIASTLDITDDNFLHPEKYNNSYIFSKWVDKTGKSVINNGYIKVREGGQAVLLGSAAANAGSIEATLGSVALAAGEKITLGMDSVGMISVVVDQAVQEEIFTADGKKLSSAIENSGTILADGGKVVLTAKVLNKVFDYAVNNSGVIQANSVVNRNGVIELIGEGDVAVKTVVNTGSIIANGSLVAPSAGKITLNGLDILQQGKITANALEEGTAGEVEIVSANSTTVDSGSSTEARALGIIGNGGRVRIDSTGGNTLINKNALIDVSAGTESGNAGSINVGAFDQLGFYGILNGRAPPGYNPATITFTYHSNLVPSVTIATDQEDYSPSGKPIITGSGFLPNQKITLNIVDPNGIQTTLNVVADAMGAFTYIYTPDTGLMGGAYFVTGTDGSRSAVVKFTDATRTASVSGNWNDIATWGGDEVPTSIDIVIINSGITVTVTANTSVASITFSNTNSSTAILTVNAGITLTVTGSITLQNAAGSNTSATLAGLGAINCASVTVGGTTTTLTADAMTILTSTISTLSISGNLNINGEDTGNNDNNATFALASGSVSVGGTINTDEETGSVVTLTLNTGAETGTLTLSGSAPFTDIVGSPTFDANGTSATVVYSRSGTQTVRGVIYRNLTLSGSGAKTLTSVGTINGNLMLSGTATATTTSAMTIGGNLDVGIGTTFTVANGITVTGTANISGTLTVNNISGTKTFDNIVINTGGLFNSTVNENYLLTGNLQVDGTGSITSGTGTWTFSGTSGTLSGTGFATINNADFTKSYLNSGTFSFSNLDVEGSGTVTLTNNGTITVNSTLTGADNFVQDVSGVLNFGGTSIGITGFNASASGNTVNYNGAAQTAKVTTYSNLTLSGSGVKTFATTPTVNGILSMEGTATVTVTTGVVTYGTNATLQYNTATARTASSEEWITPFASTGGVIIANTGTITLNAAKLFNASVPLTINSGATLATGNSALTLGGNFTNNGTFTPGTGTVTFNGTGTQTLTTGGTGTGKKFYNLTHSGSGTLTLSGDLSITNDFTNSAGIWISGANAIDINGDFNNSADFTAPSTTMNVAGSWINSGTFTHNSGTVTFDTKSGTVNITSNSSAFNNIDFNDLPTGVVFSLMDNLNVKGNLIITNGELDANGYAITVAGDWTNNDIFTADGNTVTFDGTGEQYITSGSSSFHNLDIANTSPDTVYLQDALDVDGNLTIEAGSTLDAGENEEDDSNGYSINIAGNWDNQGEFIHNNNTVTFDGNEDQTINGTNNFNNVVINNRDNGTVSFTNPTTITELTVNGDGAYIVSFTGSDNTITNSATFSNTGGVTLGNESEDKMLFAGGVDTGTNAVNMAGTVTSNNAMTFGDVTLTGLVTLNSNSNNIQIISIDGGEQDLILAGGIGTGATTVTGNLTNLGDGIGAALTIKNGITDLVWFQGTLGTNSGITAEGEDSNVQFDADLTLGDGDTVSTFNGNVTLDGLTFTSEFNDDDDVVFGSSDSNQLTLSSGPVSIVTTGGLTVNSKIDGAQDLTLNTTGEATFEGDIGSTTPIGDGDGAALTVNSSGVTNFKEKLTTASGIIQDNNAGKIIFRERVTVGGGNTPSTFNGNVRLSGLIFTANNNVTFGDSADDKLDLAVNAVTIKTLGGAGMTFNSEIQGSQNLTVNPGSGTATFKATVDISGAFTKQGSGDINFGDNSFNVGKLILSKGTINNTVVDSGTWTVAGNVEISGGATLNATSGNFYVSGDWTNNGIFDPNGSTVTFNGSGTQYITSGGSSFYNLDIANTSPDTVYLQDALDVDGNLTIEAGSTLDAGQNDEDNSNGYSINIAGNWDNQGEFYNNGNTVTFNGTSSSDITGNNTFYNLTINTTADGAKTVRFGAGDTQTIENSLILTGAEGKILTIRSTIDDNKAILNIPASITEGVNYVDVGDNEIAESNTITPNQDNSKDSGNNTNWIFNQDPNLPDSLGPANLVDGDWVNNNTPTFNFNLSDSDEDQQVGFQIQIDNNSDFSSVLVDYTSALGTQGAFNFILGQAEGSGTYTTGNQGQTLADSLTGYYWRVKNIDDKSASSAWKDAGIDGTVDFKVDTIAPQVTATPNIAPNTQGWNKDNVTISFSATDIGGSGVVNTDPSIIVNAEGTTSVNGTATDAAGNVGTSNTVTIDLDNTAPVINVTSPTDGSIYTTSQTLTYTVTDNLDASPDVTGLPSGTIFTGVGTHTVIISAADLAGNGAETTLSFTINPQPTQQSQISNSSIIMTLVPNPQQFNQQQFNTFNPPGGPVYFYHPLTPMDMSAFDALTLGNDAYQFIGGSISILGHDGILPHLMR